MTRAWMVVVLVGCSAEARRDTHVFHGITFTTPPGATLANTGNSLPGPEPEPVPGKPGEPPRPAPPPYIHPGVSVNGIGVEIWKDPSRISLEGMRFSLLQQPGLVKIDAAVARPDGWDLTYSWRSDDGAVSQVITRYYDVGADQYSCKYYSSFSKLDESERICRSIRPRAAR